MTKQKTKPEHSEATIATSAALSSDLAHVLVDVDADILAAMPFLDRLHTVTWANAVHDALDGKRVIPVPPGCLSGFLNDQQAKLDIEAFRKPVPKPVKPVKQFVLF